MIRDFFGNWNVDPERRAALRSQHPMRIRHLAWMLDRGHHLSRPYLDELVNLGLASDGDPPRLTEDGFDLAADRPESYVVG